MHRLLIIWTGAFLGALGAQFLEALGGLGNPPLTSNIPLAVIPGILLFAVLSALVPATMVIMGFACGYLILRRRAMPALLFILALVLGAVGITAPALLARWATFNQNHDTLLAWMPLLGGLAISFLGRRSESYATPHPSGSRSELVRRRLALAEGAVLVAPLLVLWPFFLVVFATENHARPMIFLIGLALLGIAIAALVALLRLLKIFFDSGDIGLHGAPRALWILTVAGIGLVTVGGLFSALAVHTVPAGVGALGLPALVPALHMLLESRASTSGAISSRSLERLT